MREELLQQLIQVSVGLERGASTDEPSASVTTVCVFHPQQGEGAVHVRARVANRSGFETQLRELVGAVARVVWCGPGASALAVEWERVGALECGFELKPGPLEGHRFHVSATLAGVQELSEQKILSLGGKMQDFYAFAGRHAEALAKLASQLDGDASSKGVRATVGDLSEYTRALSSRFVAFADGQETELGRAQSYTTEIIRLGKAVEDIASNARVLTFNARIESARIGEAGKGFAVIAQAIHELANQIKETNRRVANLATDLSRVLPQLQQNAVGAANTAKTAADELGNKLTTLERELEAASARSSEGVRLSTEAAQSLQQKANEAMVDLQFQDRTAQMLDEAMGQVRELVEALQVVEQSPEQAQIDKVGAMGRHLDGETAEQGSVIVF